MEDFDTPGLPGGIDGKAKKSAKTILRLRLGMFLWQFGYRFSKQQELPKTALIQQKF